MVRRRIKDSDEVDQSAKNSHHEGSNTYSGNENASGIRDEWTDNGIKPAEDLLHGEDLNEDSLEGDQEV